MANFLEYITPITTAIKEIGDIVIKPIFNIIDQWVPDKDLAVKLKSEIEGKRIEIENALRSKLLDVWNNLLSIAIAKEALWHTISVLTFLGIIFVYLANNLLLVYFTSLKQLVLPDEVWYTFWGLTGTAFLLLFRSNEKLSKSDKLDKLDIDKKLTK